MVTPTSRRAFLTGRKMPATPWERFCSRLARVCLGAVRLERSDAQAGAEPRASLEPLRLEDLQHARALCREFGVSMLLSGYPGRSPAPQGVLTVLPLTRGASYVSVPSEPGLWRVEAGCRVSQLVDAGLLVTDQAAPEWTVAQWFASAHAADQLEQPAGSNVERAEVLLADGTIEVFGPFGLRAQAPLRSLSAQRLVPRLFELAGSEAAQRCGHCLSWPARYRLDALQSRAEREPNLAHVWLGHQGRLGWLLAVWFKQGAEPATKPVEACTTGPAARVVEGDESATNVALAGLARDLDQTLKHILDPEGVFGLNLPLNGLESSPSSVHW